MQKTLQGSFAQTEFSCLTRDVDGVTTQEPQQIVEVQCTENGQNTDLTGRAIDCVFELANGYDQLIKSDLLSDFTNPIDLKAS